MHIEREQNTNKMYNVLLYLKKQPKLHISYKKRITTNTVWVKSLHNTDNHSTEGFIRQCALKSSVYLNSIALSKTHKPWATKQFVVIEKRSLKDKEKRQKETGEKPSHWKGVQGEVKVSKLKERNSVCFSGKWMLHTCLSTATAHNKCRMCVLTDGPW